MAEPSPAPPAARSMRVRLALFTILLIAVVSGVLVGGGYLVLRQQLEDSVRGRLTDAARTAREVLRGFLVAAEQRALLLAHQERLRAPVLEHHLGRRDAQALQRALEPVLDEAVAAGGGLLRVQVADARGAVIAASEPEDLGSRVASDDAFEAGRRGPFVGDPVRRGDRFIAVIAAPLPNPDLGVLLATVDLTDLYLRLQSTMEPAREVLVASPAGDRARLLFPHEGRPSTVVLVDMPSMSRAFAGEAGFVDTLDYRGVPVLAVYLPVEYRGWGLVAKVDAELAYAPVDRLGALAAAAVLALVAVGTACAWALAGQVTRPLRALALVARRLGAGDLEARAAIGAADAEIAAVGAALDGMAAALADKTRALEARVEQGTAALSLARLRFFAVSDVAADGIVIADESGAITYANPAAARLFGRQLDELQGAPLSSLVPPRLRSAHERGFARYLETREPHLLGRTVEVHGLRDGEEFPLELTLTSFPLDDEQERFVAHLRDVSARRDAARALRDARDAADAANRAKSEFLANMSHEIRTPLNGVLGMTEVLARTALDPEQRRCLALIRQSAQALLELLSDILDLSRIEAGRLELAAAPLALRELVGEAVQEQALSAAQKGVELSQRIPPDVPDALVGDAGRLRQVLTNLVSNAIKFTDRGQVHVRIEAEARDEQQVTLHLRVEDTGVGIPPGRLAEAFESFLQLEGSLSRRQGGSGLGLAITRRLVELMGGEVWLESAPGAGTTAHMRLRLARAPGAVAPEPEVHLQGVCVLIVDDNATSRAVLGELVRAWGMRPVHAGGASEALAAIRGERAAGRPLQLALLDACMPEVDGVELAATLRADPELAGLPLILLSSAGRSVPAPRLRELEVSACLVKPVGERELRLAIAHALGRAPRALDVEEERSPPPAAPRRVLLVEDSPVNREVARRLLELRGHAVEVAHDGREGIQLAAREPFDVILMDLQMPEVDGFQAAAAIRAREASGARRTPIVALTGHVLAGDRDRCLRAGMDDYLAKPFLPADLYRVVEERSGEDDPPRARDLTLEGREARPLQ